MQQILAYLQRRGLPRKLDRKAEELNNLAAVLYGLVATELDALAKRLRELVEIVLDHEDEIPAGALRLLICWRVSQDPLREGFS